MTLKHTFKKHIDIICIPRGGYSQNYIKKHEEFLMLSFNYSSVGADGA